MNSFRRIVGCMAALIGLVFLGAPLVRAQSSVTMGLNDMFYISPSSSVAAATPGSTSPWVTATFQNSSTQGKVTLSVTAGNLYSAKYIRDLYFNLNPSLNASSLTITETSSQLAAAALHNTDQEKADNDGFYDAWIPFATTDTTSGIKNPHANASQLFLANQTATFDITYSNNSAPHVLTAADFSYMSLPSSSSSSTGTYYVAALIGDTVDARNDAWIGATIPEPATTAAILGGFALGFVVFSRIRPRIEKKG